VGFGFLIDKKLLFIVLITTYLLVEFLQL